MLMRIDFVKCTFNSDGEEIPNTEEEFSVLYNPEIISEGEVQTLLKNDIIDHELRCAVMPKITADCLMGISLQEQLQPYLSM